MARRRRRRRSQFWNKLFLGLFGKKTRKQKKADDEQWTFEVKEHIAREIWAVSSLSAAILIFLSLSNNLGLPGQWINTFLKPIFGYGLYILPPLLLLVAALLFLSKKIRITLVKLTGMGLFIIALLSIFHLSVPEDNLLEFARDGGYGGYIGFITNYIFRIVLKVDNLGSSIVFVTTFLISLLLTFEVSIRELFLKLFYPHKLLKAKTRKRKAKVVDEDDDEEDEDEEDYEEDEYIDDEDDYEDEDEINIIKPETSVYAKDKDNDEEDDEDDEEDEKASKKRDQQKLFAEGVEIVDDTVEITNENETTLEEEIEWDYPSLDLLENEANKVYTDDNFLISNAEKIKEKLRQFDVEVTMSDVHVGPTVIQYTLKPSEGIRLSKITNLKNDLALALAAKAIRIEAPIPGKSLVGIELPAENRTTVKLKEILQSEEYKKINKNSKMALPLGRDVSGKPVVSELTEMPHLLIAGATGAGKSVGINTFLISLLYQNSPADLKLILIDPKQVELKDYNGIPHLLTPVIVDPDKAANALRWAVVEMNRRYQTLSAAGCRNIDEYNEDEGRSMKMPKIIILIDELADLMMANGKEVEASICRIAQMARAVGIHLIIATQRPSVDVITGLIKANIPTRISFAVTSQIDSRTILDTIGAEDLLGKGDMLYLPKDFAKPMRIQGIYISTNEIKKVTNKLKLTYEPEYREEITDKQANKGVSGVPGDASEEDELYTDAYQIVVEHRKASASLLQRKLKIGYARAARLLDLLEEKGVVGPVNGAKPREIYVDTE